VPGADARQAAFSLGLPILRRYERHDTGLEKRLTATVERIACGSVFSVKAYLDTNVVSAIAKDDIASESQAISRLLVLADSGGVQLVTSEITLQEIKRIPAKHRAPHERTFHLLEKIPMVRYDELLFITQYCSGNISMNSPVIQNEPLYDRLLALGLDTVDARHLFVAGKQGCRAFITCDNTRGTSILRRWKELDAMLNVSVQLPSTFLAANRVSGS